MCVNLGYTLQMLIFIRQMIVNQTNPYCDLSLAWHSMANLTNVYTYPYIYITYIYII